MGSLVGLFLGKNWVYFRSVIMNFRSVYCIGSSEPTIEPWRQLRPYIMKSLVSYYLVLVLVFSGPKSWTPLIPELPEIPTQRDSGPEEVPKSSLPRRSRGLEEVPGYSHCLPSGSR